MQSRSSLLKIAKLLNDCAFILPEGMDLNQCKALCKDPNGMKKTLVDAFTSKDLRKVEKDGIIRFADTYFENTCKVKSTLVPKCKPSTTCSNDYGISRSGNRSIVCKCGRKM